MNIMKIGKGLLIVCAGFAIAGSLLACGRKDKSDEIEPLEPRPDNALRELMRSLREADAPGFAALCVYPIPRPYPLREIDDSTAMVDYFPVMVDDSLQDMMKRASLDDWESFGWRGWSMRDEQPIWFDEGVLFVDYESKAESALRKILAKEEMMTLAPEYRDGWTPVAALAETGGPMVLRIDHNGDAYRLMGFSSVADISSKPYLLLDGSLLEEGSARSQIYVFADGKTKAQYIPDAEPPVYITLTSADRNDTIEVTPVYWRDLFKSGK